VIIPATPSGARKITHHNLTVDCAMAYVALKLYAPDNNQAIRRPISAHPYFIIRTLAIFESVVGTSTNQVDNAYRPENPSQL
jgi:hypothetical protein